METTAQKETITETRLTVWKFGLEKTEGAQEISLPIGFEIIHVDEQRGKLFFWAQVCPDNEKQPFKFHVFGTGWPIPGNIPLNIAGSCLCADGLVWHVFMEESA